MFDKFRVPRDNLLVPKTGDGLTIAYHGLNLGRLALCARPRPACACSSRTFCRGSPSGEPTANPSRCAKLVKHVSPGWRR